MTTVTPEKDFLSLAKEMATPKPNGCGLCQLKPGSVSHTPGTCCIRCRNYDLIDLFALCYSLAWVKGKPAAEVWPDKTKKPTQQAGEMTVADILTKGLKHGTRYSVLHQSMEESNAKLAEARKRHEQNVKDYKGTVAERKQARDLLDAHKSLAGDESESEMWKLILQSAQEDLDVLSRKVASIQQNITLSKAEYESLNTLSDEIAGQVKEAKVKEEAKRDDVVRGLARKLVQYLVDDMSSVWGSARGRGAGFQLDPIDRARFFFTWIAHSIVFDRAVKQRDPLEARDALITLHLGRGVCNGLSQLFEVMFNATSTTPPPGPAANVAHGGDPVSVAHYLGGEGIGWDGPQSGECDHAWNSFTFAGQAEPQLIDITWGMGGTGEDGQFLFNFDPTWFTRSPEEFKQDHYEYDLQEKKAENNIAKRPFVQPPFIGNLWYRRIIDYGSIKPATYQLEGLVKWTFEIAANCPHFHGDFPPFSILVGNEDDVPVAVPFVKQQQQQQGGVGAAATASTWRAEFDPTKSPHLMDQLKQAGSTTIKLVSYYADQDKLKNKEPMKDGEDPSNPIAYWLLEA